MLFLNLSWWKEVKSLVNPYTSLDRIENIIIMLFWNSSAIKGEFLLGERKNEKVIKKRLTKQI